ncbi:MAG: hypothetical protein WC155_01485 [Candidatus Cloacimonadales bacterium]
MNNSKSLAEKIIEKDPNGVVVIDDELNIIQFNKAFLSIFNIMPTHKIIGENVNEILAQEIFPDKNIAKDNGVVKHHHKTGKFVKTVTFRLEEEDLFACFFVNITDSFHNKRKLQLMKTETIKKAQAVIDNQMRVAQEIASLLGETTAESKVTLLQLMDVLKEEGEI